MLKASLLSPKEGMHDVPSVSMRKKAFLLAKKKESSSSLKQKRKNFSFCEEQGKLFSLEEIFSSRGEKNKAFLVILFEERRRRKALFL